MARQYPSTDGKLRPTRRLSTMMQYMLLAMTLLLASSAFGVLEYEGQAVEQRLSSLLSNCTVNYTMVLTHPNETVPFGITNAATRLSPVTACFLITSLSKPTPGMTIVSNPFHGGDVVIYDVDQMDVATPVDGFSSTYFSTTTQSLSRRVLVMVYAKALQTSFVGVVTSDSCTTYVNVTSSPGTVFGVNADGYVNNMRTCFLIQPPSDPSRFLTLTFGSFSTEEIYDYVQVFDGDIADPQYSLLGSLNALSGDYIPIKSFSASTPRRGMVLVFTSNEVNSGRVFGYQGFTGTVSLTSSKAPTLPHPTGSPSFAPTMLPTYSPLPSSIGAKTGAIPCNFVHGQGCSKCSCVGVPKCSELQDSSYHYYMNVSAFRADNFCLNYSYSLKPNVGPQYPNALFWRFITGSTPPFGGYNYSFTLDHTSNDGCGNSGWSVTLCKTTAPKYNCRSFVQYLSYFGTGSYSDLGAANTRHQVCVKLNQNAFSLSVDGKPIPLTLTPSTCWDGGPFFQIPPELPIYKAQMDALVYNTDYASGCIPFSEVSFYFH